MEKLTERAAFYGGLAALLLLFGSDCVVRGARGGEPHQIARKKAAPIAEGGRLEFQSFSA
jgi:hypothetical protein